MNDLIYPPYLKPPYTPVQTMLAETYTRICKRVQANNAEAAETKAALAWCRANGNPHRPVVWPQLGLHGPDDFGDVHSEEQS